MASPDRNPYCGGNGCRHKGCTDIVGRGSNSNVPQKANIETDSPISGSVSAKDRLEINPANCVEAGQQATPACHIAASLVKDKSQLAMVHYETIRGRIIKAQRIIERERLPERAQSIED